MKTIFSTLLILAIANLHFLFAQNPESGAFWSLKYSEETLNVTSNRYEGMGATGTPTGLYAFVFKSDEVILYSDGWMGENYKSKVVYPITHRNMTDKNNQSTNYMYVFTENEKIKYGFEINVSNEDNNYAMIYFDQDFRDGIAYKRTSYFVWRQYIKEDH